MDSAVSAHVQAIPSRSHSDNGPEIWCTNNSSSSLLRPTGSFEGLQEAARITIPMSLCQQIIQRLPPISLMSG